MNSELGGFLFQVRDGEENGCGLKCRFRGKMIPLNEGELLLWVTCSKWLHKYIFSVITLFMESLRGN